MRRFKIDGLKGDEAYLRGQEARHALKVLRLKKGDEIIVFDGEGREFLAVIEAASPTSVKLRILEESKVNRDSPLVSTLYMGITNKVQKFELAVQKTTELGVTRIVPVVCRRSSTAQLIKNWEGKLRRWREIAVNASKQCGRSILPEILEPVRVEEIEDSSELSFVLWERGGKSLKNYQGYSASSVSFLVGPEGGLEREEIELLKVGRHFRIGKCKLVVGRNQRENQELLKRAKGGELILKVETAPSPVGLLKCKGEEEREVLETAASIVARYSDAKEEPEVPVSVYRNGKLIEVLKVKPNFEARKYQITL